MRREIVRGTWCLARSRRAPLPCSALPVPQCPLRSNWRCGGGLQLVLNCTQWSPSSQSDQKSWGRSPGPAARAAGPHGSYHSGGQAKCTLQKRLSGARPGRRLSLRPKSRPGARARRPGMCAFKPEFSFSPTIIMMTRMCDVHYWRPPYSALAASTRSASAAELSHSMHAPMQTCHDR